MTDMFIPKKERVIITIEAIVYVILVVLASYFTICGDMFIRMVPMIYFLGIFGVIAFNKPIVTVILSCVSTAVFGCLVEHDVNSSILLFVIYSAFMIICGEATGHILNLLYENYKLRKFIKYYHKIIYVIVLAACIFVPLFFNNLVNSNFVSYLIAEKDVNEYINENYAYSNYYMQDAKYNSSYKGGMFEFNAVIDGINVQFNYTFDEKVFDVNMNKRKETLNRIANAEINILLKKYDLTNLDVECRYDYSEIATVPDIIKMNILNVSTSEIDNVVSFLRHIKEWSKYSIIDRIDIAIEEVNVSITKKDLAEKEITTEYILNGMKYETLSSKEGR